jgi:sterol desaturase/sphingolipid hydroxylase (fatty acid hydroxylase superfamily)
MTESQLRLSIFLGLFLLFYILEALFPRRKLVTSKKYRWIHNVSLMVLNTFAIRLIFPLGAIGTSLLATVLGWGLLQDFSYNSSWWAILGYIIFLDFCIYIQHILFHKVGFIWRLHRVHHAEKDLDVSSGMRFHTIEMILSMVIKSVIIVAIGIPVNAVLYFEIILNGMAMFNHSNLFIPAKIDKVLRKLFVTPDMHRIHHSVDIKEANTNFGFNLSIWDYLFRTVTENPKQPQETIELGEPSTKDVEKQSLWWILTYPFK